MLFIHLRSHSTCFSVIYLLEITLHLFQCYLFTWDHTSLVSVLFIHLRSHFTCFSVIYWLEITLHLFQRYLFTWDHTSLVSVLFIHLRSHFTCFSVIYDNLYHANACKLSTIHPITWSSYKLDCQKSWKFFIFILQGVS